jgi:hypothetical protein
MVIAVVDALFLFSVAALRGLKPQNVQPANGQNPNAQRANMQPAWSLANALSEESDLTVLDTNNLPYSVNGAVVKETVLVASTSRLIAFLGSTAILALFLGFGDFALWDFGTTGTLPDSLKDAITFMVSGLTLFAPYAVNKASAALSPS